MQYQPLHTTAAAARFFADMPAIMRYDHVLHLHTTPAQDDAVISMGKSMVAKGIRYHLLPFLHFEQCVTAVGKLMKAADWPAPPPKDWQTPMSYFKQIAKGDPTAPVQKPSRILDGLKYFFPKEKPTLPTAWALILKPWAPETDIAPPQPPHLGTPREAPD
jgi:hypothetical protein